MGRSASRRWLCTLWNAAAIFETFPNFRNCLGVLYLPNGADGSELPGYAYNGDVLQIGTTTLTWKNGREQDVPEYLLIHPQFKELLWKITR